MSLVERFVVGVDIERFSSRVTRRQLLLQRELDRMLDDAAKVAGISREQWERRAEGDGEVAALPAGVDLLAVVRRFVYELDQRLGDHNDDHNIEARIRLRVAMHIDVVIPGALGYAGPGFTDLQRLLDSVPVRSALIETPEANLALIISEPVYQKTVLQELGGLRPRQFKKVEVNLPAKGFNRTAYVYVPKDFSAPPKDFSPPPIDQSSNHTNTPTQPPKPIFPIPPVRPRTKPEEPPAETPEPNTREPPSSTLQPPTLSPSVRALVQRIRSALAKNEIERADVLTTLALLEAAGRGDSGWLRAADSLGLPDVLFTEVNDAWARASGGAWGFGAQRKRIDGLKPSAPGGFRKLLAAFGWDSEDGIVPYAQFTQRGSRSAPFYPTLRNPERERSHREWDDEWSAMVISVYDRLQAWEQ